MAQTQLKVFIDLDGTLIDVSSRHYKVYSELALDFGGEALPKDSYWALKRHMVAWPELLQKSQLSADIVPEFLDAFISKIENPDYLKMDTLFPSALATLQAMAKQNQCYLVSLRRNHQNLIQEIYSLGIDTYFQKILTGHSETDGYDKKIELIAAELQKDEQGLIIGDTEADIITGQKLGLTTVAVLSGIRDEKFLAALQPDYMIKTIAELTSLPLSD